MQNLELKQISKVFSKNKVLDDITLTIPPGSFGLLGPNGAGKTTLMRILATLIEPSSGKIEYGTVDWRQKGNARQLIGYLPQKFSMYKHIKVKEALKHIADLKNLPTLTEQSLKEILNKVNLHEQADKKIGTLSGGMIRRFGIAQAIIGEPRIIIVDEPTAGLDPEERIRFRKVLRNLSQNSTVLISTHIVEDIEATCSAAAFLVDGQLVRSGSISEIARIAEGKVWELEVGAGVFYEDQWEVMSSRAVGDKKILRIFSETQPPNAISVPPSLQEGYLYITRNNSR
ncbi:ABC transporter ATP-binding protein [Saccharibacillus endophyticus]|uniref:ABC transporter ATP-binding protein n=1 Tax=Saccharibacillus endophyticus TaxID=2060666 RepID=A0ABQ1ZWW3_9BACL|nr:ABC transporter ATP-binding protein [Saccharibacillus endophyticus]GGH79249.1 ABC transporter ATP-binding protein [Saccharibacillus endophyticus]